MGASSRGDEFSVGQPVEVYWLPSEEWHPGEVAELKRRGQEGDVWAIIVRFETDLGVKEVGFDPDSLRGVADTRIRMRRAGGGCGAAVLLAASTGSLVAVSLILLG